VLYAFDPAGETINLELPPPVMFYKSHVEVEAAIQRGEIRRPEQSVNGVVFWQWPDKRGAATP
jgi:hypothetical protein